MEDLLELDERIDLYVELKLYSTHLDEKTISLVNS